MRFLLYLLLSNCAFITWTVSDSLQYPLQGIQFQVKLSDLVVLSFILDCDFGGFHLHLFGYKDMQACCRRFKSLPQLLDVYKQSPGLVMHWLLVGPSGHHKRPRNAGVLRSYTHCRRHATSLVKSIVNTYFVVNIVGNPHAFEYRCASAPPCVDGFHPRSSCKLRVEFSAQTAVPQSSKSV